MKVSIIIPNFNGEELLKKNLPEVIKAAKKVPGTEIIIVDDGSEKRLKALGSRLKDIVLIENDKNLGFPLTCNRGVETARGEIVVLLNNDVVPEEDFLVPLIHHFDNPRVFGVSCNETTAGWAKIKWVKGFFEHEIGGRDNTPHISGWVSGGSGAFRKSIWEELGGFDKIYSPGYWEDLDICYRAWKRGYVCLWEPESVVYHKHETTFRKVMDENSRQLLLQRNQLLFIWKNITNYKMVIAHKFALMKRCLKSPGYLKIIVAAMGKLPYILIKHFKEATETPVSDDEVFKKFTTTS